MQETSVTAPAAATTAPSMDIVVLVATSLDAYLLPKPLRQGQVQQDCHYHNEHAAVSGIGFTEIPTTPSSPSKNPTKSSASTSSSQTEGSCCITVISLD